MTSIELLIGQRVKAVRVISAEYAGNGGHELRQTNEGVLNEATPGGITVDGQVWAFGSHDGYFTSWSITEAPEAAPEDQS